MTGQKFTINSEHTLKCYIEFITKLWHEKKWIEATYNTDKQRSTPQNSSLHVYCQLLADMLNDSGQWLVIEINQKRSQVPWSMQSVKDYMWRPIQKAVTQKDSSARLSTKECMSVYETLNLHTAERLGISVDWPSKESM